MIKKRPMALSNARKWIESAIRRNVVWWRNSVGVALTQALVVRFCICSIVKIASRIVIDPITNAVMTRTNKVIVVNLVMLPRGHTQAIATKIATSTRLVVNQLQGLLQERNVPSTPLRTSLLATHGHSAARTRRISLAAAARVKLPPAVATPMLTTLTTAITARRIAHR